MSLLRARYIIRKYGPTSFLNGSALLLILLGLYPGSILNRLPQHNEVAAAPAPYVVNTQVDRPRPLPSTGKPVKIIVPAANIDLVVINGDYTAATQNWTLSETKAQYATVTPLANNQEGNTFIYGHNSRKVFGALPKIQPGDYARIETDNGKVFLYILLSSKDVDPTDTSLFAYEGPPILTVQTCSGRWYEKRRLFTFSFVKVEVKA